MSIVAFAIGFLVGAGVACALIFLGYCLNAREAKSYGESTL